MDKLKAAKLYISEFFRNANGYTSKQRVSVFETLEGLIDAELARQVPHGEIQNAMEWLESIKGYLSSESQEEKVDRAIAILKEMGARKK